MITVKIQAASRIRRSAASLLMLVPLLLAPAHAATPGVSPSSAAFKAAADKMMGDMDRKVTGDPDQDFVAGMLPHHQGAVEMARVELRYGKNPEMRRLAQAIIVAQDKEIAQMRAWQNRHPPQ